MLVQSELMTNQPGVKSVAGNQRLVVAGFHNLTILQRQNSVGVADGAQAVGDDQAGTSLHQSVQCLLDQDFAFGVEGTGGFVEDQDTGSFRMARAIDSLWRCPPERLMPLSPRMVSYPSGSLVMNPWALAAWAAATSSSSVASGRP